MASIHATSIHDRVTHWYKCRWRRGRVGTQASPRQAGASQWSNERDSNQRQHLDDNSVIVIGWWSIISQSSWLADDRWWRRRWCGKYVREKWNCRNLSALHLNFMRFTHFSMKIDNSDESKILACLHLQQNTPEGRKRQ